MPLTYPVRTSEVDVDGQRVVVVYGRKSMAECEGVSARQEGRNFRLNVMRDEGMESVLAYYKVTSGPSHPLMAYLSEVGLVQTNANEARRISDSLREAPVVIEILVPNGGKGLVPVDLAKQVRDLILESSILKDFLGRVKE